MKIDPPREDKELRALQSNPMSSGSLLAFLGIGTVVVGAAFLFEWSWLATNAQRGISSTHRMHSGGVPMNSSSKFWFLWMRDLLGILLLFEWLRWGWYLLSGALWADASAYGWSKDYDWSKVQYDYRYAALAPFGVSAFRVAALFGTLPLLFENRSMAHHPGLFPGNVLPVPATNLYGYATAAFASLIGLASLYGVYRLYLYRKSSGWRLEVLDRPARPGQMFSAKLQLPRPPPQGNVRLRWQCISERTITVKGTIGNSQKEQDLQSRQCRLHFEENQTVRVTGRGTQAPIEWEPPEGSYWSTKLSGEEKKYWLLTAWADDAKAADSEARFLVPIYS